MWCSRLALIFVLFSCCKILTSTAGANADRVFDNDSCRKLSLNAKREALESKLLARFQLNAEEPAATAVNWVDFVCMLWPQGCGFSSDSWTENQVLTVENALYKLAFVPSFTSKEIQNQLLRLYRNKIDSDAKNIDWSLYELMNAPPGVDYSNPSSWSREVCNRLFYDFYKVAFHRKTSQTSEEQEEASDQGIDVESFDILATLAAEATLGSEFKKCPIFIRNPRKKQKLDIGSPSADKDTILVVPQGKNRTSSDSLPTQADENIAGSLSNDFQPQPSHTPADFSPMHSINMAPAFCSLMMTENLSELHTRALNIHNRLRHLLASSGEDLCSDEIQLVGWPRKIPVNVSDWNSDEVLETIEKALPGIYVSGPILEQNRRRIHDVLLDRYRRAINRPTDDFISLKRAFVVDWPGNVPFINSRTWTRTDIETLMSSVFFIDFVSRQ